MARREPFGQRRIPLRPVDGSGEQVWRPTGPPTAVAVQPRSDRG
jgi:hypothetical protein